MATDEQARRLQLAAIHLGAKALGLGDDTYRDLLEAVAGVRSAAQLDRRGRLAVLDKMRALGWEGTKGKRRAPRPAAEPVDKLTLLRKVRAQLAAAGRADAYADAMAQKMFQVDRFDWLEVEQLTKVIQALAYDAKRHGRRK